MRGSILTLVLLMVVSMAEAQTPFNGRIRNLDGSGIKATIRVKDSDKVTRADSKGRFGLTDLKPDDTLYIIYRRDTLEIALEGRNSIDVVWAQEGDSYSAEESEELSVGRAPIFRLASRAIDYAP